MSSSEGQSHDHSKFRIRTRRRHLKSRKGCFECKRRRIKCDELEPSCTRCILTFKKCVYPPPPLSAANDRGGKLPLPSPSCSDCSPSSNMLPVFETSPSFDSSVGSSTAAADATYTLHKLDAASGLSDTDLYHHYLQHTSRTFTHCGRDQNALQVHMPTLALQNKTVFHSLLAVSAACLCCDMVSKESHPDIQCVTQTLMNGYRHYNLASERLRNLILRSGASTPETLLATAILLVPFATASQQINHWLSQRKPTQEPRKVLNSTPRDVIVILRGIKTTLHSLDCGDLSRNIEPSEKPVPTEGCSPPSLDFDDLPASLPPSQKHVMFPILAATSEKAFSRLQERLGSNCPHHIKASHSQQPNESLSACAAAFEVLDSIRISTFPTSNVTSPRAARSGIRSVPLPRVAPWLRSYAARAANPLPTEPLTRPFLTFLVQTPQAYLDLVLPLLDQRLESAATSLSKGASTCLSQEQALALDIYAHWSVFMFLVDHESWWIGNLPGVTLTGMINRYGPNFVARSSFQNSGKQQQWWPGSMLNI